MSPPQLVRALGQAARLLGRTDTLEALLALEERVTLVEVLDLLDELADAVDRQLPTRPGPRAPPTPGRATGRPPAEHTPAVLEGVRAGRRDRDLARELGLPLETVRSIRRRAGLEQPPRATVEPAEPAWAVLLREAHGRQLVTADLARELGWTVRTVQQRLHLLGLRAWRIRARSAAPAPGQ